MGHVGEDLAEIQAFDFPFLALRVSDGRAQAKKSYFTSHNLWMNLQKQNALDKAIPLVSRFGANDNSITEEAFFQRQVEFACR